MAALNSSSRVGAKLYRFGPASCHRTQTPPLQHVLHGHGEFVSVRGVPAYPMQRVTSVRPWQALVAGGLTYASSAGNHEFDSPTYYWVQMNALGLGACPRGEDIFCAQRRARRCDILEHVWADVSANFFSHRNIVWTTLSRL